jgi:urease accessory protein
MLQITEKLTVPASATTTLTLPFELRQKSRLRATLDNGAEAGLFLERGTLLRHGDLLRADSGEIIEVRAAPEEVSTARAADTLLLARACYHLGNRHVPLQVAHGWLRYLHDHVLDDMLLHMGLDVTFERAPFEPEAGAYAGQAHGHGHTHQHDHEH